MCSVISNWGWFQGWQTVNNKPNCNKIYLDQNFLLNNFAKDIVKKLCRFTQSCSYNTNIEQLGLISWMTANNKPDYNKICLDQNFLLNNFAKDIVKKLYSFIWSCSYNTDIEWHTKDNMNQYQKMGKKRWMVDRIFSH